MTENSDQMLLLFSSGMADWEPIITRICSNLYSCFCQLKTEKTNSNHCFAAKLKDIFLKAGLSLRFKVAELIQQIAGKSNSLEFLLVLFFFFFSFESKRGTHSLSPTEIPDSRLLINDSPVKTFKSCLQATCYMCWWGDIRYSNFKTCHTFFKKKTQTFWAYDLKTIDIKMIKACTCYAPSKSAKSLKIFHISVS